MGIGFSSRYKVLGWRGQLDRAQRWHERVLHISQQHTSDDLFDVDKDFDYIFAFFQSCYHLRDWLRYSGEVSQQDLDDLFRSSVELKLCQDLCNGSKHYELTRARVDSEFSLVREYVPSEWTENRPHTNENWFIISGQYKYDLFELASICMEAWQQFLSAKGLI